MRKISIGAVMISCAKRSEILTQTLENWSKTDWAQSGEKMVPEVILDSMAIEDQGIVCDRPQSRQELVSQYALAFGILKEWDYILFLEDDLSFNLNILHNLQSWRPLAEDWITMASLYNPNIYELQRCSTEHWFVADPIRIYGSQAYMLSRECAQFILKEWGTEPGMQDIKMSRIAARMRNPIYYHSPSLVQHEGKVSTWTQENRWHNAWDFDGNWRALAMGKEEV